MPVPTTLAHQFLNKSLRNIDWTHATAHFVSIHTADPGDSGANEFTGYDGTRKAATFGAPASKSSVTTDAQEFLNFVSEQTITHFGVWDAATAGTFIWGGALEASKLVPIGETLRFAAGEISADVDQ